MLAHPEGHVRVRLRRLAFLKFFGKLIALGSLDLVDLSIKDIQIGHPDVVCVPSDLAFGHPKRTDLDLVNLSLLPI